MNIDYTYTVSILRTHTADQEAHDQGRLCKSAWGVSVLGAQDKKEYRNIDILTASQCNVSTGTAPLSLSLHKCAIQ